MRLIRSNGDGDEPLKHDPSDGLNLWQEAFCAWNAERLGISLEASVRRYRKSWNALPGGHSGAEYRRMNVALQEIFSVIADDSPAEVYDSYKLHVWVHLLRQISQAVPVWRNDHPVVAALAPGPDPTIIDFGCGAAQASVSLALTLKALGRSPRLFLADIPTLRLDFVRWLCRRVDLECEVGECTKERPSPDFPAAQVVVATEIFEHLHDPLAHFDRLDAALVSGGYLITNVDDHEREFMHVSPNLQRLRDRLAGSGYRELKRHTLFRKA